MFMDLMQRQSVVENLEEERSAFTQERDEFLQESSEFMKLKTFQESKIASLTHQLDEMTHNYALLNERLSSAETQRDNAIDNYETARGSILALTESVNQLRVIHSSESKTSDYVKLMINKAENTLHNRHNANDDIIHHKHGHHHHHHEHDLLTESRRRSHIAAPTVGGGTGVFRPQFDHFRSGVKAEMKVDGMADIQEEQEEEEEEEGDGSLEVIAEDGGTEVNANEVDKTTNQKIAPATSTTAKSNTSKNHPPSANPVVKHHNSPARPSKSSETNKPLSPTPIDSSNEALWSKITSRSSDSQGNGIQVAVRVRPLNQREKDLRSDICVKMSDQSIAMIEPTSGEKTTFTFDYIFDTTDLSKPTHADQKTVFASLGVDILRNAWDGYNACLFAYGQTGAGKSWR